jgi:hypothetical protein
MAEIWRVWCVLVGRETCPSALEQQHIVNRLFTFSADELKQAARNLHGSSMKVKRIGWMMESDDRVMSFLQEKPKGRDLLPEVQAAMKRWGVDGGNHE